MITVTIRENIEHSPPQEPPAAVTSNIQRRTLKALRDFDNGVDKGGRGLSRRSFRAKADATSAGNYFTTSDPLLFRHGRYMSYSRCMIAQNRSGKVCDKNAEKTNRKAGEKHDQFIGR